MPKITYRRFDAMEVTREQVWRLLEWCMAHGATEFVVNCVGHGDRPSPACDEVEAALRPFAIGAPGEPLGWRLTSDALPQIRRLFPDGLLADPTYEESGWVEDLECYRQGERMFWTISHENYGFVQLTDEEHAAVRDLGITTHAVST